MINPNLSLVPAKPPNFGARFPKIPNGKKKPLKILKHFLKIFPLLCYAVSSYQEENANKALFIDFDRRVIINQN